MYKESATGHEKISIPYYLESLPEHMPKILEVLRERHKKIKQGEKYEIIPLTYKVWCKTGQ